MGNAMVYAMYKPIAEDDTESICALLNLYKQLYRIIGTIILSAGLLLFPFVGYLEKGSHPSDVNLYILYLIYLFNTVISYYLFGYKQSILMAFQRNDIISKRAMIARMIMYLSQTALLFALKLLLVYFDAAALYHCHKFW